VGFLPSFATLHNVTLVMYEVYGVYISLLLSVVCTPWSRILGLIVWNNILSFSYAK